MNTLESYIKNYIEYCTAQKRLDTKTLKAYKIDLRQFSEQISTTEIESITTSVLETYITNLHQQYSPKTVKRKIASIKAFFHYLEYKDIIILNPFNKLQIKFREPVILPKTIPLKTLEVLFNAAYAKYHKTTSPCQKRKTLRDIAVFELLFATGIRISELCSILLQNMDLQNNIILIHGKGSKERLIHICDPNVLSILNQYYTEYYSQISACGYFFVNNNGNRLSDQSVRDMINKYCRIADIDYHITPHMFRHTFATQLLEEDVDIRYIQTMLGHSSINVTEIYTHVTMSKQKDILASKHPRRNMNISN
ncbi:tyrosine-type recombinase/integrase [Agathobacter rectalis]|jgi:site-specific recombinase XerD|uniref:Recombinase XerC n=1 Tax=Agathobacter rectalis TaxID=39491 RepID=A0A395UW41_9FIRM|nr:tyrosine-type recombinase/integrase [Agathobacter rectalis]RGR53386.1 recombinase XerC [Agathobacter rectalis]RGT72557.1 recombinase XerC [Agathobacter rectalis]RGT76953.1 recombinase XerC [Agathobacter rectalis]